MKLPFLSQIAKLTHAISVFTEGILMMKTTLVGIIKVIRSLDAYLITLFASRLPLCFTCNYYM